MEKCFILGLTGPSCCGKTHFRDEIVHLLSTEYKISITVISTDWFYKPLSGDDLEKANRDEYDFDNPGAIDGDLFEKTVQISMNMNCGYMEVPIYNFSTKQRDGLNKIEFPKGRRIIIVEGIFALCFPKINELYDFTVFIETDADTRMIRRLRRDIKKSDTNNDIGSDSNRNRTNDSILRQYERFVKPGYQKYIEPTQEYADLVIPYNHTNEKVVRMVSLYLLHN